MLISHRKLCFGVLFFFSQLSIALIGAEQISIERINERIQIYLLGTQSRFYVWQTPAKNGTHELYLVNDDLHHRNDQDLLNFQKSFRADELSAAAKGELNIYKVFKESFNGSDFISQPQLIRRNNLYFMNFSQSPFDGLIKDLFTVGRHKSNEKKVLCTYRVIKGQLGLFSRTLYYPTGQLLRRYRTTTDPTIVFGQTYYPNGKLAQQERWKSNRLEGLWQEWSPNGAQLAILNFTDGKLNGIARLNYLNSQTIYASGKYEDAKKEGTFYMYTASGTISKFSDFKSGQLIGTINETDNLPTFAKIFDEALYNSLIR